MGGGVELKSALRAIYLVLWMWWVKYSRLVVFELDVRRTVL